MRERSFTKKMLELKQQEAELKPSSFDIILKIGGGSFGQVYLVKNLHTERILAMKVVQKEVLRKSSLLGYAQLERDIVKDFHNHPFIVSLNHAFQTPEKLFLCLEYCHGGDLGKTLRLTGLLTEDVARLYLAEICLGLEALH